MASRPPGGGGAWRPGSSGGAAAADSSGGLLFHQPAGDDDPEGEETDEGGGGGDGNHSGNPRSWGVGAARRMGGPGKIAMRVVSGAGVTPDFRLCKIFIAYYPKKLPPHNNPGGAIRGAVRGAYGGLSTAAPVVRGGAGGVPARRGFQRCRIAAAAVRPAMGLGGRRGFGVGGRDGAVGAQARRPGLSRRAYLRSSFLGSTTQRPKSPMKAAAAMAIIIRWRLPVMLGRFGLPDAV